MKNILVSLVLFLASTLVSTLVMAQGEQKQVFGNTEVHYMLLNTKDLDVGVAEIYGIQRSGKLGFLMVSVLEVNNNSELPTAVPAIIEARVKNLVGQMNTIKLEEIREQGGLYYVGTFRFANEDIYRFEIDVKTQADQSKAFQVRHQQRMYFE